MLDRNTAKEARDHILKAIQHINQSWPLIEGKIPDATFAEMKRTAGIVIGTLDVDYLCKIFEVFPDLDDVGQAHGIDHLGQERPSEGT